MSERLACVISLFAMWAMAWPAVQRGVAGSRWRWAIAFAILLLAALGRQ
jgi:hypothetical protein